MSLGRIDYADMRVLVALSNKQLADYVWHFLRDMGAGNVQLVHHSRDAISRARDYSFTHFIVGYALDGLGGCEFARYLRMTDGAMSEAPIMTVMSSPDRAKIIAARDAGINEVLAVPFAVKKIEERLLRIVSSRQPFIRTHTYIGPCRRRFDGQGYTGAERRILAAFSPAKLRVRG